MPVDISGLRTELLSDPLSLGYSGQIAAGSDNGVVAIINQVRTSGFTVFRNDITPREVVNRIVAADFTTATQIQLTKLELLFQGTPIDATLSGVRTNFQNIFSGTATLLSGFLGSGLSQRNGSRAEILFGTGTNVTSTNVATALRG